MVFNPALIMLNWAGTTWTNEMNVAMNLAPGAGSIAPPVDQHSGALPLYHGCTLQIMRTDDTIVLYNLL